MPEGSINLGHVVGPTGPQGATGPAGPQGVQGPVGPGVPSGGTANQVLRKTDGTNYNTEWHSLDDADIPSSAVSGQTTVEGALGSLSQQIANLALEIGPYMFEINSSGHLILYYPDDYSGSGGPPFRLGADGHLYYDY